MGNRVNRSLELQEGGAVGGHRAGAPPDDLSLVASHRDPSPGCVDHQAQGATGAAQGAGPVPVDSPRGREVAGAGGD